MKKLFKNTMLVIMLVCAIWRLDVFAADTDANNYVDPQGRQLALYYNAMTMRKGAGTIMKAEIVSEKGATGEIVWKTADSDVAAISKDGKLTAVNEGTTTVTATLKGTPLKKECTITVVGNPEITISKESMIMEKGESATLTADITKQELDNKSYVVTWMSTNENVAVVDENGNVKVVGSGTATIRASIKGTTSVADCKIKSLQRGENLNYGSSYDKTVTTSSLLAETSENSIVTDNAGNQYRRGAKIGNFVITGYCTRCNSCGPRTTSSGVTATEGITVAVKKSQIAIGTKIVIGDHVYIAQDVHGNHRYSNVIDVFFGTRHGSECFLKDVPVYYAK